MNGPRDPRRSGPARRWAPQPRLHCDTGGPVRPILDTERLTAALGTGGPEDTETVTLRARLLGPVEKRPHRGAGDGSDEVVLDVVDTDPGSEWWGREPQIRLSEAEARRLARALNRWANRRAARTRGVDYRPPDPLPPEPHTPQESQP